MVKADFARWLKQALTYFERKEPSDATVNLWYEKVKNIPVAGLPRIHREITGLEAFPRERELNGRDIGRDGDQILGGLLGHAAQGGAHGLGLHHPHGLAAHKEEVVGESFRQGRFPHRYAQGNRKLEFLVILDLPTGCFQEPVDLLTGFFFGFHGKVAILRYFLHKATLKSIQ